MAMLVPSVGEGIPDVITPRPFQISKSFSRVGSVSRVLNVQIGKLDIPISSLPCASNTLHPSLAGAPVISNPTRRLFGPDASSLSILDLPGNAAASSDRLSFPKNPI